MEPPFDPARHRFAESRWFEDFAIGERFHIPSRTMTEALFAAFQLASGDNDPIHYDRDYCRRKGHPEMLAHGMQVFIQSAAGAGVFPALVADSLVAMLGCSFRTLKPVYVGDTLYPELFVQELTPQNTTGVLTLAATIHNQKGERVLDGEHRYLIRKRAA
ncbi:MaoC family dehydratase [Oceanibacterium hippocampi]|uniref:Bifunctional protein PaaZ n=1 Tax=Oceanibacterium hippocampi TaxID=745714 RepID=A0A1Y5TQ19_9PROT|nr:MaoC family dehydratase [Oceanibacterium hippocampi]SLN69324.1 Bifunctional protein PaaZ [Oceanibacterium hippocampi]